MESLFDSDMVAQLESLLKGENHEDSQDTAALALPPTAGILGAVAASLRPELKEKPHVEIPHEPDIFKPTKSMLDILSEQIDSDLNKRMTEFGETNGFPVVFVFYQTLKDENGVSKATCDIKMFKSDEKQDARLFALQHAGEFGIFDPRRKDEQILAFAWKRWSKHFTSLSNFARFAAGTGGVNEQYKKRAKRNCSLRSDVRSKEQTTI